MKGKHVSLDSLKVRVHDATVKETFGQKLIHRRVQRETAERREHRDSFHIQTQKEIIWIISKTLGQTVYRLIGEKRDFPEGMFHTLSG